MGGRVTYSLLCDAVAIITIVEAAHFLTGVSNLQDGNRKQYGQRKKIQFALGQQGWNSQSISRLR